MIRLANGKEDKLDLFVVVDGKGPLEGLRFDFFRHCASETERRLLDHYLRLQLRDTFREIRRVSYLAGWRDAKGKKNAKRNLFPECPTILEWEKREAGL